MIFYFSGTGNSQWIAHHLAKQIHDSVTSMNASIKREEQAFYESKRPLIFVVPTYAYRIPNVVESWIDKTTFSGNHSAYFVMTCGGSCGNAIASIQALCKKKGWRFMGLKEIKMPENYLAMFSVPDENHCHTIMEQSLQEVASIAQLILHQKPFISQPITLADRFKSGPIYALYYPLFVHDRGFTVSNDCISCGLCMRRCPLNNIKEENGLPVWKGNCTHCMACIAGCPVHAIDYKQRTRQKYHHFIWKDEQEES